ncbi:four helix bundle protein [Flammeovirgaceae bacterium SG7u.111]|nr:four helix bundle protein [Flammeovirgaceae bacterium SG7u.132]WPO38688.1 four helix bundle protein [Flammeovirgaceae bacterium SG7u.111]
MKKNEILDLSFQFALDVIEYVDLLEEKRKYVIARQLLKSGTSIGANIREAQNVHSLKDFVAKCIIAMKEADETEYWLLLCEKSKSYPNPDRLLTTIVSIKKLLAKIISTSRKKLSS